LAPSYGNYAGNKAEILGIGMIRILLEQILKKMVYRMDRMDRIIKSLKLWF